METSLLWQTTFPRKLASYYHLSNQDNETFFTIEIEMCHMLRSSSLVRPGLETALTSIIWKGSSWLRKKKIWKNPGVLKIIQHCQKLRKKAWDRKRKKVGYRNKNQNTSDMNTYTTQATITSFHTSQPDDNIITVQVKMLHMGSQIVVNSVATNNHVSVIGLGSSKRFYIHYDYNSII